MNTVTGEFAAVQDFINLGRTLVEKRERERERAERAERAARVAEWTRLIEAVHTQVPIALRPYMIQPKAVDTQNPMHGTNYVRLAFPAHGGEDAPQAFVEFAVYVTVKAGNVMTAELLGGVKPYRAPRADEYYASLAEAMYVAAEHAIREQDEEQEEGHDGD